MYSTLNSCDQAHTELIRTACLLNYFIQNTHQRDFFAECTQFAKHLISSGWKWEHLSHLFGEVYKTSCNWKIKPSQCRTKQKTQTNEDKF